MFREDTNHVVEQKNLIMENILLWSCIISIFCKIIIHHTIHQPKSEDIFEKYLYLLQNTILVLLPIKKVKTTPLFARMGNYFLIIFYLSLIILCLKVYIVGVPSVPQLHLILNRY